MIVQPGSPSHLVSPRPPRFFTEMTTTCVVLITLPFSVVAGFGDPFSEATRGRPLAVSLAVALRAVAFRNVTRRKETMCLGGITLRRSYEN